MGKKTMPFDGMFAGVKDPSPNATLSPKWDEITKFSDWADVPKECIDPNKFKWELALDEDVTPERLQDVISLVEVDTTQRIADPLFCFDFNGHNVLPRGNIMNITGLQKNGKSQFLNILCAISLTKSRKHAFGSDDTFGSIKAISTYDKVLWIDTEQGAYDIQANNIRLFNLMGLCTDPLQSQTLPNARDYGLHILSVSEYMPEQRRMITQTAIKLYDPDLIIIDGIRDMMHDINDHGESEFVLSWLKQLSKGRDVWNVIHQNPTGGDKIRGAIGTELMNKCSLTFEVKKQSGMFSFSVPVNGCRQDAGEKAVLFRYGVGGLLYPVTVWDIISRIYAEIPSRKADTETLCKKVAELTGTDRTRVFAEVIAPAQNLGYIEDYETDKGKHMYNFKGYGEDGKE